MLHGITSIRKAIALPLICFAFLNSSSQAQTTYTWNGSVSTAWDQSANWTPSSGFPQPADHAVVPTAMGPLVLTGPREVQALTVSGGAMDLGGFSITVTGNGLFSGGSITNGMLILSSSAGNATFSGTLFDASVSGQAANLFFNGSVFNAPVQLIKSGGSDNSCQGGNIFNNVLALGNTGTGELRLCRNATDHYNGGLELSCTGRGFRIGDGTHGAILPPGQTISVGAGGFSAGRLIIQNLQQQGTALQQIVLQGTSLLSLNGDVSFEGDVALEAPRIQLNGATFHGDTRITTTGENDSDGAGGCVFMGELQVHNTGEGRLLLSNSVGDTYHGNLLVSSTSDRGIRFGENGGEGTLMPGALLMVGPHGFEQGLLRLRGLKQLGNTPQTIVLGAEGRLGVNGQKGWSVLLNGLLHKGKRPFQGFWQRNQVCLRVVELAYWPCPH